jgi:hypothetical protein
MNDAYKQLENFNRRINSEIDKMRQTKGSKRDTKGLLARQMSPAKDPSPGSQDFTKRIANYVNSIRQRRLDLAKAKDGEVIDV